eukprot:TRINITY_DN123125_c0_g1_i1.p1 TRINITY_DN123125_c0_g1~~TRINITY_DN123125_c0_g1_i1.p1  ORF type:complete len:583 (+),score=124.64 TRINITY_DN123125_c0_g1_i1:97-1845(+)
MPPPTSLPGVESAQVRRYSRSEHISPDGHSHRDGTASEPLLKRERRDRADTFTTVGGWFKNVKDLVQHKDYLYDGGAGNAFSRPRTRSGSRQAKPGHRRLWRSASLIGEESAKTHHSEGSERSMPRHGSLVDVFIGDATPFVARSGNQEVTVETRLFDRKFDDVHGQRRRANVIRVNRLLRLFMNDAFHVFFDMPMYRFFILFALVYCLAFGVYALIYRALSDRCNLDCRSFNDALFLSIETMMTIGYGVKDEFFKPCPWYCLVLISQCLLGVSLDGSLVGVVYARISKGNTRSAAILFSDMAVIRTLGENTFFSFQVCEMRKKHLLDCTVKLFLFTRPFADPEKHDHQVPIKMSRMRLAQPDDAMGGMLFLTFPNEVVHCIDAWSPMAGGDCHVDRNGELASNVASTHFAPVHRTADGGGGNRYLTSCPVCGECFYRPELMQLHAEYLSRPGTSDEEHKELAATLREELDPRRQANNRRQDIKDFLDTRFAEVVCILEGVDPVSGASVQARHSYAAEEIVWDHHFVDCVKDAVKPNGKPCVCIDFEEFHEIEPDERWFEEQEEHCSNGTTSPTSKLLLPEV